MNSKLRRAMMALISTLSACVSIAQSQSERPVSGQSESKDSVPGVVVAGDKTWSDLVEAIGGGNDDAATALQTADAARAFHAAFPEHPKAAEAKRLEAVLLVEAVGRGQAESSGRMEATVRAVRNDKSLPPSERAIVAGTYDFHAAGRRVRSLADLEREYEGVARGLIQEFPDQPQGYISLVTQAGRRNSAQARAMAAEVAQASAAPEEARTAAQRLLTRLDLVGQPLDAVLDDAILRRNAADGWKPDKPGLIYFWATWSAESVAFGERLKARLSPEANVLAVCLDIPDGVMELGTIIPRPNGIAAAAAKLPGRVVELPSGPESELAVRLGANAAPLLYLVGANGRIIDVRGLDGDVEAKLKALGL